MNMILKKKTTSKYNFILTEKIHSFSKHIIEEWEKICLSPDLNRGNMNLWVYES